MLMRFFAVLLSFVAFSFSLQAAFLPEDYVPASDSVYIEIAPASQVTGNLKKFWAGLRTEAVAEEEIHNISEILSESLGVDPFKMPRLRTMGFDTESNWAISGNLSNQLPAEEKELVIYIPASDSLLLYRGLKNKLSEPDEEDEVMGTSSSLEEITADQLFHYNDQENLNIYVARGENFIVLSNQQKRAEAGIVPAENAIAKSSYYQNLKNHFKEKTVVENWIFLVVINPDILADFYSFYLKNTPYYKPESGTDIFQELRENSLGSGILFSLNQTSLQISNDDLFKPEYLKDQSKIFPSLLTVLSSKISPLPVDRYPELPVFYLKSRFNFPAFYKLVKSIDVMTADKMNKEAETFKAESGIDVETEILPAFNGAMSMLLGNIPPENGTAFLPNWKAFVSFGLDNEKSENIHRLLQYMEKKNAKSEELNISHVKYSKGQLYTFQFPKGLTQKPETDNKSTSDFLYLYVDAGQATFLTDRKYFATLGRPDSKNLLEKIPVKSEVSDKDALFFAYFNIAYIVDYINLSSLRPLAAAYLTYLQNIDNINIHLQSGENYLSEKFSLELKTPQQ